MSSLWVDSFLLYLLTTLSVLPTFNPHHFFSPYDAGDETYSLGKCPALNYTPSINTRPSLQRSQRVKLHN